MNDFMFSDAASRQKHRGQFQNAVDLKHRHSFGLSVHAAQWFDIYTLSDVFGLLDTGESAPLILGEGSNTVFLADCQRPIWHMAIKNIELLDEDEHAYYIKAGAGVNWHSLVEWSLAQGLWGLENLALIPGSVGACPVQNIGAYGLEIKDRIFSVDYIDRHTRQQVVLPGQDCHFAYRDSRFKNDLKNRALITAVTFYLPKPWVPITHYKDIATCFQKQPDNAWQVFDRVVKIRTEKLPDPRLQGNAGSFFKNPLVPIAHAQSLLAVYPQMPCFMSAQPSQRARPILHQKYPASEKDLSNLNPADAAHIKLAAAWLIDQSGLKGHRLGGAAVSERQPLVLINHDQATPKDVKALIIHVQNTVYERFGILLEPEPVLIHDTY